MIYFESQIDEKVRASVVVLFLKGTRETPVCVFSSRVVEILNELGVSCNCIDVTHSSELRQQIKEYSDWPTFPQLYVGGELVGGCDIVEEMYKTGELQKRLVEVGVALAA